jgi:hypothetical protein
LVEPARSPDPGEGRLQVQGQQDVPRHRQRELINSVGEQSADSRLALELGYAALDAARRAGRPAPT